jgi:hypothetical protein
MSRLLNNWLASYIELTKNTEPPARFHLWVAVTIIGALLGRKCEVKLGPETFFPNLYTILVGPPGVRKGTAIKYGQSILKEIKKGTSAPDVVTKEQLIAEFELAQDTVPVGNEMITHSSMFVIAPELVNFIKENDYERLGYLTDLYDGRDDFIYKTKTSTNHHVVNPGLWILGATTPNWIEIAMRQLGVGGGMTSRIICVFASKKGNHVPVTKMKPFDPVLRGKLITDLAEISRMAGRFTVTNDADRIYSEWYLGRYKETCISDNRFASYWERLPSMVIKTSMIVSASRRDTKVVEAQDIVQAISMFEAIHPEMPQAFGGLGQNVIGSQTEKVRNILREKGQAHRHEILRALKMDLSEWDYRRVRDSLIAERFCKCIIDQEAGDQLLICLETSHETTENPGPVSNGQE